MPAASTFPNSPNARWETTGDLVAIIEKDLPLPKEKQRLFDGIRNFLVMRMSGIPDTRGHELAGAAEASECGHKTSPTRLSRWNAICGPRPDQAGGWGKPVGQCFTGSGQRREEMGRYWFGFQGTANIGHPNINWRNLHVPTSKLLPKLHPILQKRGLGETRKIISKWACFLP